MILQRLVFSLLLLFCSVSAWAQSYNAGSEWLYGPGESWVYEPGQGLSFDLSGGLTEMSFTNPDGSQAVSEGEVAKLGFYFPYSVEPYFDIGARLSFRFSSAENNANNSALSESTSLFGFGPGVEMRFYRFVIGGEIYFDEATFETAGTISNDVSVDYLSFHYYVGVDIPIRPFQLRIQWQKGVGSVDSSDTGLSQDADFEETSWYIGIRYSTDFTWQKFKDALL